MTLRGIQAFLLGQYGTEVSPEYVTSVTDAVMDEVLAWQSRLLEPMYPVVFFRCSARQDSFGRFGQKQSGLSGCQQHVKTDPLSGKMGGADKNLDCLSNQTETFSVLNRAQRAEGNLDALFVIPPDR
jgi:hypothetical protein